MMLDFLPQRDLMVHELGDECLCGPETEIVHGHLMVTHYSLDGREDTEHHWWAKWRNRLLGRRWNLIETS